jgi:hypothetical protein
MMRVSRYEKGDRLVLLKRLKPLSGALRTIWPSAMIQVA